MFPVTTVRSIKHLCQEVLAIIILSTCHLIKETRTPVSTWTPSMYSKGIQKHKFTLSVNLSSYCLPITVNFLSSTGSPSQGRFITCVNGVQESTVNPFTWEGSRYLRDIDI